MRRRVLAVLATALTVGLSAPGHASSIAYENARTMTGSTPNVFEDQFELAPGLPAGQYRATLVDRDFLDTFELLGLIVDASSANKLVDLRAPGTSAPFDLTHGVTYFVGVVGIPGDPSRISRFAVTISQVPIPASFVLLGSALAGLVVVRRRRGAKGSDTP